MKLKWGKGDKYHVPSVCGRYTISKHFVGEVVTYTAWRIAKPMWVPIGGYTQPDSRTAARLCQEYEDATAVEDGH